MKLILLLLITFLAACSNSYKTVQQESNTQSENTLTTVSDVINACRNLDSHENTPVKCSADYIGDTLTMFVVYDNPYEMGKWLDEVVEYLGVPFCDITNRANRKSNIVMFTASDRNAAIYSCELEEVIASGPIDRDVSDSTNDDIPTNLSETIRLCESVQESNDLPISCEYSYLDNIPTMMITVSNTQALEKYADDLDRFITVPYCDSSNKANRNAFILIGIENLNKAMAHSCETGKSGEWFDLKGERM